MAEPERTISERALNRALLARQTLLERAHATLPRALERMGGLQAQYAPSMYIGLWSRVERFQRDQLTRALERRAVVQGTLMRTTIHLVSRRDYWPLALAVRRSRRQWWLRLARTGVTGRDMEKAAEMLRARLVEGPIDRRELLSLMGKDRVSGIGLWVDLVRVPPSGTWDRRRADLFGGAEQWVGPPDVSSEGEAVVHLVRRYLGGFGPASRKDIAVFTGLSVQDVASALEPLTLRRFHAEDGAELLDLPGAPLPSPDRPAPVRFLPTFDATLLVHARRTGILPEPFRPAVFQTNTPQSVGTFLVDGAVAGTWKWRAGTIECEPFGPLSPATSRALDEEREHLAELHR